MYFHSLPRLLFTVIIFLALTRNGIAQTTSANDQDMPKLVIGIVVDQMRYDYLTRFYERYGEGGFKRLINGGFNCKNNHYNYVPTYTGPGHASIYTGSTPKYHGIIGNNWYDKETGEYVYCASDSSVKGVGTEGYEGEMSPRRMKVTTFADENRLFTQFQGKTIGISLKDRGSILPAGHTANAAYWFVGGKEGKFISSSFYLNELPKWVSDFNSSGKVQEYLKPWETLYDLETYLESGADANDFENLVGDKKTSDFPYDVKKISNGQYNYLRSTPFGNSLTADFAMAAITAEKLGKDKFTDVLAVSFSSTDYIGHGFGVNSKEIEDTYLRLDKDLERFLSFVDSEVGKENYLVFLTSDHGAVDVPAYLNSQRIPAGYVDNKSFQEKINDFMKSRFQQDSLIENISNNQIFLNREKLRELNIDLPSAQKSIVEELITYPNIDKAYTGETFVTTSFSRGIEMLIMNGYDQKRSGDVIYVYDPNYLSYSPTGSSHGTSYNYDTHVPLIFYGKGIKHGSTLQRTEITDIAPTISAILGISFPNASIGNPLEFVIEE